MKTVEEGNHPLLDGPLVVHLEVPDAVLAFPHRSAPEVLLEEGEVVRARGILAESDYEEAVKAHEKGLGYVAFNGVLKRGVRISRVEQIKGFRPVGSSEYE